MSKEQNKFGHLIDEATKTPRTDKAAFVADFGGPVVVDADFARELEKELADAMAKLRKLEEKKYEQNTENRQRRFRGEF